MIKPLQSGTQGLASQKRGSPISSTATVLLSTSTSEPRKDLRESREYAGKPGPRVSRRDFEESHDSLSAAMSDPDLRTEFNRQPRTEAQNFCRDRLGVDVVPEWNYGEPPIYGGVMLDGTIFHFAEGESEPRGVHILVYVKWISACCDELQRTKVEIESELESHDYGETQFTIKDLNGYTIGFTETIDS